MDERQNKKAPKARPGPGTEVTLPVTESRGPAPSRWDPERLPVVEPKSYFLAGEVARGGIGRIVVARDVVLDRRVAIKERLPSHGDDARFVREALITARLQHPSIVPIYRAARWPNGAPFYAMKLVTGHSLDELITATKTIDERLGLLRHVIAVAEAIAYAHSERIIHRDLKPDNVLVGPFGETVVIDWGLAKELDREEQLPLTGARPPQRPGASADAKLTTYGAILGTPMYMAPEQARGEAVDERADVYAVGTILYHLLAGVPPYSGTSAEDVLASVVTRPPRPLAEREPTIPHDLVAIVNKAIAREPQDRYPSAKELAADLRRFETGQFVAAHRYSPRELALRFVRRYKAPLFVALLALGILASVGTVGLRRILHERARAEQSAAEAVDRADALVILSAKNALDRDPNATIAWLKTLSPRFGDWHLARSLASDARARGLSRVLRGHRDVLNWVAFTPDGRFVATVSDDHTARLWDVATGESRALEGHTNEVHQIAISPDGRRAATSSLDGTLRVWDLATGESRVFPECGARTALPSFSLDGTHVFAVCGDATIRVWNVASGTHRALRGHTAPVRWLRLSPDGKLLVSCSEDRTIRLWTWETGEARVLTGAEGTVVRVEISPDGKRLASTSDDGVLRIWDLVGASEARVLRAHASVINGLTFTPDGKTIVTGGSDGAVKWWSADTGELRGKLDHKNEIIVIRALGDNRRIVASTFGGPPFVHDMASGEHHELLGFHDIAPQIDVSPDGAWAAAASFDRTARLFSLRADTVTTFEADIVDVAASATRVAATLDDGRIQMLSIKTGADPSRADLGARAPEVAVAADTGATAAATAGEKGGITVLDATGRRLRTFDTEAPAAAIAISADGKRIAWVDRTGTPHLGDVDTGAERPLAAVEAAAPQPGETTTLAFSPSGADLVLAGPDRKVRVWDLATGAGGVIGEHKDRVLTAAWSPSGNILCTGSFDHTIGFWSPQGGDLTTIAAGGTGTQTLVFTRDGARLLALTGDNTARIWDVKARSLVTVLSGAHTARVIAAAFSPDGKRLVTGSEDRNVAVWDLEGNTFRLLRGHTAPVRHVLFAPDGQSLLSVGMDRTVRRWPDDLPFTEEGLRAAFDSLTPEKM